MLTSCVIIPIYTTDLRINEAKGLQQCLKILKSHDIYVTVPDSLSINNFDDIIGKYNVKIQRFDDTYFESIKQYNKLCLSYDFYERFSDYDYMLICQLDALVFKDELQYWCDWNYDYIGSPWCCMCERKCDCEIENANHIKTDGVGNGGFSLRRVKKFKEITKGRNIITEKNEDVFFSTEGNLRIPNCKDAVRFAMESNFDRFRTKISPFGCHSIIKWNEDCGDIYEKITLDDDFQKLCTKKTIKVNYTAFLKNDWKDIISLHLDCLSQSNLLDIADQINFFAYPYNDELNDILEKRGMDRKINIIWNKENSYEYEAINDLIDNPYDFNLYFHTKGSSKNQNDPLKENIKSWNYYMSNYMIMDYRQCIRLLEDNDCVGVDFIEKPCPHYHGNFWWASRKHMEKLKNCKLIRYFKDYRMIYEMLLGGESGRFVSLCKSEKSLYNYNFTVDKWKTDPTTSVISRKRRCIVTSCPRNECEKLPEHTEIDDTDFICFQEDTPLNMCHGNWKILRFPDELCDLDYMKRKSVLKILLFKYLDYDSITYLENYSNKTASDLLLLDSTIVTDENEITLLSINGKQSLKNQVMFNKIAKTYLECGNEVTALKDTVSNFENDLLIIKR